MTKDPEKNFTLMLAIAVLFLAAVTGYWISNKDKQAILFEKAIDKIETQSTSDELDSIENDLEMTDFSDIDRDLEAIEKEL